MNSIGLINDGFRYRDLTTHSFLTKDPAGFVDGPNLYSYVNQNPWTYFDAEGLKKHAEYYGLYHPKEFHFKNNPKQVLTLSTIASGSNTIRHKLINGEPHFRVNVYERKWTWNPYIKTYAGPTWVKTNIHPFFAHKADLYFRKENGEWKEGSSEWKQAEIEWAHKWGNAADWGNMAKIVETAGIGCVSACFSPYAAGSIAYGIQATQTSFFYTHATYYALIYGPVSWNGFRIATGGNRLIPERASTLYHFLQNTKLYPIANNLNLTTNAINLLNNNKFMFAAGAAEGLFLDHSLPIPTNTSATVWYDIARTISGIQKSMNDKMIFQPTINSEE